MVQCGNGKRVGKKNTPNPSFALPPIGNTKGDGHRLHLPRFLGNRRHLTRPRLLRLRKIDIKPSLLWGIRYIRERRGWRWGKTKNFSATLRILCQPLCTIANPEARSDVGVLLKQCVSQGVRS